MNKEFEKQALRALEIIRAWETLTGYEKLWRNCARPSAQDYRLANVWIRQNDVLGEKNE